MKCHLKTVQVEKTRCKVVSQRDGEEEEEEAASGRLMKTLHT